MQCHVASKLFSIGQKLRIQNTINTQGLAAGKSKVQN